MTIYAIGDIQGCYNSLTGLLEKIRFSTDKDQLWFVGDLVNRGPDSLKVLQLIMELGENAITVLGNHDLHALAILSGLETQRPKDTLDEILNSPNKNSIIDWIRQQSLMHVDQTLPYAMVHAGVYPGWTITQAMSYAREVEAVFQSDNYLNFLRHMYGNTPEFWSEELSGWDRFRFITNSFTRMRFVTQDLKLDLRPKGHPESVSENLSPWFMHGLDKRASHKVIFGHWSTLGYRDDYEIYAIDTGCLWGGKLTAMALKETDSPELYSIDCKQAMKPAS